MLHIQSFDDVVDFSKHQKKNILAKYQGITIFFKRFFSSIFFFSEKKKEAKKFSAPCVSAHPNTSRLAKSPMLRWRFYARLKVLGPELRHNGRSHPAIHCNETLKLLTIWNFVIFFQ
jgi:hypothetical protein